MSVIVEPYKTATIVHVGRTLDYSNAKAFKEACFDRLELGTQHFILDFSRTGILDSTGLGAIFSIYRETSINDGKVVFAALTSPVRNRMALPSITGIAAAGPMFPRPRTALPSETTAIQFLRMVSENEAWGSSWIASQTRSRPDWVFGRDKHDTRSLKRTPHPAGLTIHIEG